MWPCRSSRSTAKSTSGWRAWRRRSRSPVSVRGRFLSRWWRSSTGRRSARMISDTVQASLNDAIREQNLRVAGYPRIEPKEAATGGQLEFSAVFEVYPEIKLGELSGVTIERPVAEVTPADIDRDRKSTRLNSSHSSISYA